MNVLLVSQCSKNALTETRRVLDQFAERRGERTWQTAITQEGLSTLRKLLRQKARKNTAVACHWIRGHDHSELMWIVGDASRFNAEGAVPTNTTQSDVLKRGDENDWHNLEVIRLLAQLAGLLHDLGKASVAFQERLADKRHERNLYRHEWVSLRLWQAFVGTDDDVGWLTRLADADNCNEQDWLAKGRYQRDGVDATDRYPFKHLPPLAAALGWLVVTHHRLPVVPVAKENGSQDWLGRKSQSDVSHWLKDPLAWVAHDSNEIDAKPTKAEAKPYWDMAGALPVVNAAWRSAAAKVAKRLLECRGVLQGNWLDNPYVMHLARLCLMLSDHHYSSLGIDGQNRPVMERQRFLQKDPLKANTTFDRNRRPLPNQSLSEHLLGVGQGAAANARALPGFERYLPRLANHRGLRRRTAHPRFAWQNRAFDQARGLREQARTQGAFIINMASTGCGKTIANARLLYALADPQVGLRASYALGLRTLTLQTGQSYRKDLHLGEDELAILVGGSASRALFEHYQKAAEATGSASGQSLLEEDSHVLYEGSHADHPLLARALSNPDINRLVSAPVLVTTVDHLVPATDSLRAGRQIAPMLRLMSSDLILDELDDYDINDLPALTRLVYWAGLLGSRVVLSSATLPPSLVEGMFLAYQAGRKHYSGNRGEPSGATDAPAVPCLWVDEFDAVSMVCTGREAFVARHGSFVECRIASLERAIKEHGAPRRGELVPLDLGRARDQELFQAFAGAILDAVVKAHDAHHENCPKTTKQVSFGLVRLANIEPLFEVAQALLRQGAPEGYRIHLCVYHSRFPLVVRSAIEALLDGVLDRREAQAVYQRADIHDKLKGAAEPNQIFLVLGSPVTEVGRDHDYDWAVVEPSSMRSLIQLAGRVQRHRQKPCQAPNVLVFDTNILHYRNASEDGPIFLRPGFESTESNWRDPDSFRLKRHRLGKLLEPEDYQTITARPRIQSRLQPWAYKTNWIDLEHARLAACMLPERDELNAASIWQHPAAALTAVLPQQQPFRRSAGEETELLFLPDEYEETLVLHRIHEEAKGGKPAIYTTAGHEQLRFSAGPRIAFWQEFDLMDLLQEMADARGESLRRCAEKFTVAKVWESIHGWKYHPALGFGKKK